MPQARVLADAVVVFHAAYVAFVVFGMVAIVAGLLMRRGWVRNFWFRALHLTAIRVVVAESALGLACPLTTWEGQLRRLAGQEAAGHDFLADWAHRLIFIDAPPRAFTLAYVAFGAVVLLTFLLAPPRLPRRGASL